MLKIKSFIKKYIGEISILSGVILAMYNILNFSSSISDTLEQTNISRIEKLSREPNSLIVHYYYNQQEMILITLGIFLIILGYFFLKAKNNK